MTARLQWGCTALLCAAGLSGCATTGPYDASSPADRYVRRKCEEAAASPDYQSLSGPKVAFVWRDPESGLECHQLQGASAEDLAATIRARFPSATLVASGNQILTNTTVSSGGPSPSWGEVIAQGMAAGNARNQELQQRIAMSSDDRYRRTASTVQQPAPAPLPVPAAPPATVLAPDPVPVVAAPVAQPSAHASGAATTRHSAGESAPRTAKRPVTIGPNEVQIKGEHYQNIYNNPAFAVKLHNLASVPVDCDVTLRASFWGDSNAALNPISGTGLARIKVERGSVSNLMPGAWGTALEVTHLVEGSRVDYSIEGCRTARMYLISRNAGP